MKSFNVVSTPLGLALTLVVLAWFGVPPMARAAEEAPPVYLAPIPTPICMYANDWATPTIPISLWDINNLTGAASNPRSLAVRSLVGIEWDASNGLLWGVNVSGGPPFSDYLYTINPTTGAYTAIGSTGLTVLEGDIALDPTTGILYLAAQRNKLYTLNQSTGAATLVGTMNYNSGPGLADTDGIAFDANGNLFALDGRTVTTAPTLYQINPINASVISSLVTSSVTGSVSGYDVDPNTGIHYVLDGDVDGTKYLRTLNPSNGQFTNIGPSGLSRGASGLTICEEEGDDCVNPPANLQAWWPFDEGSGSSAADISNANNGTVYGASWTTGVVDDALDFDGSNDYVQVPDHWTLDAGTGDFSIDLWIKTSDTGHVTTILDKRSSSAGQYYGYLFFLYKGYLALQLADGGWTNYVAGSSSSSISNGFVADGQWHLVAVTVDRNDSQGIRWYIDGNEVGTRRNPTGRQGNLDNSAPVRIARQSGGSYLDATMDEIEFFKRELSASEVQTLFGAGSAGKCKSSNF